MKRTCIYHAGCPDGFGAAWAVWRAWGDDARYIARGHDDPIQGRDFEDELLVFADIAPPEGSWRELADAASQLVVLDHHVTALERYDREGGGLVAEGHHVDFDLSHSGAVLAWRYFHPDDEIPALLAYVEDQDLWAWKLHDTREVNAAIGATPRSFGAWDALASTALEALAAEGSGIVRNQRLEVERALPFAHPITVAGLRMEALNSRANRALIGHELALRARFEHPCGVVYRVEGTRIDVSIYSIGDFDVGAIATRHGGGGHRNAAGFSVSMPEWLERFL